MTEKNTTGKIEEAVPLSKLWEDPANARLHDERNREAIAASLRRFGQTLPIVALDKSCGKRHGQIVAGNGRKAVMESLGWESARVLWVTWEAAEAAAYGIADNRTAELASWDDDVLAQVLHGISEEDAELALATGFSQGELDALLEAPSDCPTGPDVDAEPVAPPRDPTTQAGDLWLLGNHRLLCGDSTDSEMVVYALDGKKASLCLTDPPYGIGLEYDSIDDSEDALRTLAERWLPIAQEHADAIVFSPGVTQQWLYPEPAWVICWFYGAGQNHSQWGFNCWQPFLCYGKDPSLANGRGCRPDAVNMNTPANHADSEHPCPKPLALWRWMLERLTFEQGAIVFDPFCGSGTTIMACENTWRHAVGIELSPAYCDVIVQRWQTATGQDATLAKPDGETFNTISERRDA